MKFRIQTCAFRATAAILMLVASGFAARTASAALLDLSDVSLKFANYGNNGDEFGRGLASGDFNGDGYLDLAAGGPANNSASGTVSVFFGQSSGLFLSIDPDQTDAFESNEAGDRFGDVFAVGDFDGNGFDDLIASATGENGSAGAIFQFRGGSDLNLNTTEWPGSVRFSGNIGCGTTEANEKFGSALAVGDFNGDGRDDLAIGMPGQNGGSSPGAGAVCIVLGGMFGISGGGAIYFQNHPDLPLSGGVVPARSTGDAFGAALAVGDFNRDGFDDLAIGAPFEKLVGDPQKDVGVSVYFGSANNTSATVFPTAIGIVYDRWNSKFGATLAAGDIDADGLDDLIIAAPDGTPTLDYVQYPGRIFSCSGSATFDVGPYYEVTNGAAGPCSDALDHADLGLVQTGVADRLGTTLGVGHFNADGAADLFVGDVVGNVFAFPGVPLKSFEDAALVRGGETYNALAANSAVAKSLAPGDFDGDGTDDLAVGTPRVGLYGFVHVVGGFAPPATSHMPMAFVGYPNADYCGSPPCFGGVDEPYRIGKFEVRNVDYVEFLNAVDPSGANALLLYQVNMFPGIWKAPLNALGARYVLTPGLWAVPVVGASFINAARLANWLHNGKPTGGVGGTESGAYLLTGGGPYPTNTGTVVRQAGADFALPTEREWIKAALHNRASNGMHYYMTGSDYPPACVTPFESAVDAANCNQVVGGPLDVGRYPGTAGPYGTVDQGGNVYEWTESLWGGGGRYVFGGSYASAAATLNDTSSDVASSLASEPDLGFRLIALPEPGIGAMALAGLAMLTVLGRLRKSS